MEVSAWTKATHASFEATQGPTFGGGYRVTIYCGKRVKATAHFPVPEEYRNWSEVIYGGRDAYKNAKKWAAGFGVS